MAEPSMAQVLEETTERCRNLDAPLADRLQAFADEVRVLDPVFADSVERMIARLKASGAGENAPEPGEPMPEFMLPDQNGRLISLALRSGIPMREIWRQLRGISSDRVIGLGPNKVLSVPDAVGIAGSAGYSSTGRVWSVNRELPQTTVTRTPSVEISTGLLGSAREMSASSRPETRTVPSSSTSASTDTRAETS